MRTVVPSGRGTALALCASATTAALSTSHIMLSGRGSLFRSSLAPSSTSTSWGEKAHQAAFFCSASSLQPELNRAIEELKDVGQGEVTLERVEQSIYRITLRNPERKNAFSGKMMVQLHAIVNDLVHVHKDCVCVVLEGSKGSFCTGGDLNSIRKKLHAPPMGDLMCVLMQHTLSLLHSAPCISIAHIEGFAMGGGAEVITACDFRVACSTAKIQFAQSRMGVTTGWGGATRLAHLVKRQDALLLLAGAERITADEAKSMGLVDIVAPAGSSAAEVMSLCRRLMHASPEIVRAFKTVVHMASSPGHHDSSLRLERATFASFWGSGQHRAAIDRHLDRK